MQVTVRICISCSQQWLYVWCYLAGYCDVLFIYPVSCRIFTAFIYHERVRV